MKEAFKKFVVNIAEMSGDIAMNTVCLGGFYQPETPNELL
jgi:cyclic lactone autoinducer peptide